MSGKTTFLKAVSGLGPSAGIVTVSVPDARLDALAEVHRSPKRVPVHIELVDVHATERTEAAAIARLREVDAVVAMLPAFGGQNPLPALQSILEELVIADLGPIEKRLERARKDPSARTEVPALRKAAKHLSAGGRLAEAEWESDELTILAGLAPLTLKPIVAVLNVDESGLSSRFDIPGGLAPLLVAAELEAEVSGMNEEDAAPLLSAYGIESPAAGKVVGAIFGLFDLITFFTINEKETHAWEVRRGIRAPEAAAHIHTDMQKGFIRAEAAPFDEVVSAGGWEEAKGKGLVRVEGKDYEVRDGDVLRIRFAV